MTQSSKAITSKPLAFIEIPEGWSYRGEGNSNLVISLPNTGKVLHIKKTEQKTVLWYLVDWIIYILCLLFFIIFWFFNMNTLKESANVRFYMRIMRPLLGEEYVSEAREVMLTQKEIRLLEERLQKLRPEARKHKVLQPGRASILDDFAFVPENMSSLEMVEDSFAIEIKPKQGWMPLSMKLYPRCIYCMSQYFKMEKGQIMNISSYCPEDFFSGNELFMIKAIKALIENPQNNFRIFKNGELVYGQDFHRKVFTEVVRDLFNNQLDSWASLKEEFCTLIKNSLTMKLNAVDSFPCKTKKYCEWEASIRNKYKLLFRGSVLERILSVQMLDVEGSSYYNSLLDGKTLNSGTEYVEKLLKEMKGLDKNTCIKCGLMLLSNVTDYPKGEIDLRCVPYLISSIANDCSLMVSFRKVKRDIDNGGLSESILPSRYGNFAVRIGIFDLFPKPIEIIKHHVKRNERIFQAYVENFSAPQRTTLSESWKFNNTLAHTEPKLSEPTGHVNKFISIVKSTFWNPVIARGD